MIAVSGTNIFGQKVFNPINGPVRRRAWPHRSSNFMLSTGGDRFGDMLKEKRIALVKVVTDDLEIPLGMLMRADEDNQVRVGYRTTIPRYPNASRQPLNERRRHEWRLDAINRDRIREMVVIG